MDNSPIHRKNLIRELVEAGGHQLLHFSALKIDIIYSPINTSRFGNYL